MGLNCETGKQGQGWPHPAKMPVCFTGRRRGTQEAVKKAVKTCYDAGIPMVVGCDSGIPFVPFGEAVHDEMACLCEAGIPPLAVLTMATSGNAELLNMADRIGTIEPGKEADLIVLTNDPLADIRNTKTIELVLSRGKVVYQAVGK